MELLLVKQKKKIIFAHTIHSINSILYYFQNMNEKDIKRLKQIFAQRLQNARKMNALSQAQLADRLKELANEYPGIMKSVSATAIEKYESEEMFPESSTILCALSQALNVPLDDLLRPITVDIDRSKFKFRKKCRLGKKAEEAIKLTIQSRIEKYIEIERIAGEVPTFDGLIDEVIISDEESARKAAMALRQRWNLGMGPIHQPITILEEHGVKVIEIMADPELFDGTSIVIENVPVLVINKDDSEHNNSKHINNEERRRLTLWHEYCHKAATFAPEVTEKREEELCNVFANEMLIPADTFKKIIGRKRNIISSWELKNLQQEFGISVRALLMKARQLGVITANRHKWYCISLAKPENEEFRRQMDKTAMTTQHTSRYDRLVYRCLFSEAITTSKAASMLGISIGQLRDNLNFEISNGYSS